LNAPFEQAVTLTAPDGSQPPPDRTLAGKPAAKIAADVRRLWPTIPLTAEPVTVALDTDAGSIEISLDPAAAPNHVRNFLALAAAGYFDGLVFERTVTQVVVPVGGPATGEPIRFVTAGCPVGDGSPGRGHLGYFLKPERTDAPHAEGSVGVWREEDERSNGVRFYITLGPAPLMDGKYTVIGRVTKGMDAVRAIADAPTRDDAPDVPEKPVVIRKAARK
jgi:cyclophilin family peptidyl-prolyl cis-trans isomerase